MNAAKYFILAFFSMILCSAGFAQIDVNPSVDKFIEGEMERSMIPGVSLAVIKSGSPLIVKGYGLANIEHNVPVRPETIFQSGSVGKQFTAAAVMLLVEEGKIGLDEKIGKYLGEIPGSWANITVRNLLTHTSGMTDYPRDFDFRKDYTEDELLNHAKQVPLSFQPGTKWEYSNLGYMTLGVMIGKVTGKFYGDFLQERIFKPLGMTSARIISESDIVPNRAAGYVVTKGSIKNQTWVSPSLNTTADGSLYLSMLDMIRWEKALAGGMLLHKETYERMWTPVRLSDGTEQPYGFGWSLRRINGKRVIEHSGSWQGFKAHIARYPDNGLTVIVFANSSNANPDRLANRVGAIVDPTLKPVPMTDPDPKASAEFRRIFEGILSNKPEGDLFIPEVLKALEDPEDRLLAHLKTLGPIRNFELMERQVVGDKSGGRYSVEFDSMTVMLELARVKDGKIFHFRLEPQ
jgi:CubicO group peptidase (beta-lactamase class C family)